MPKKKPTTTKRGQHHKFKSFVTVLVNDNNILKVDTNVVRKHPESFERKTVKFEKRNIDPAHFRDAIYQEFPSLSGVEFSLWRLSKDKPTLIPLPSNVNNATALCDYEELNRSSLYIRLMTAPTKVEEKSSSPSVTDRIITFEDDDGDNGQSMVATASTQPNTSDLHNIVFLPQACDDGNGYALFEMELAKMNAVLRSIPVTSNQVSRVAELNQTSSSFQTGTQYGDKLMVDQSLQSNTFHHGYGMEAILSSENERKRKHFPDSDDQNQSSKFHYMSTIHQGTPSDLRVTRENEVAMSMISMATQEPHDGFYDNLILHSGNTFPQQMFCRIIQDPMLPHNDAYVNPHNGIPHNFSQSAGLGTNVQLNTTSHLNTNQLGIDNEDTSNQPITNNADTSDQSSTDSEDTSDQHITNNADTSDQSSTDNEDDLVEVPKAEPVEMFKCKEKGITDFTVLKERLYIVHRNSEILSIHSSCHPFEEIKTQKVEGMKCPLQISASSKKNCLYILDGDESAPKCIWVITDSNEFSAKKLVEDAKCCSLSTTNEGDLVLLDDENHCLHLYKSENGRCFRCIHLQGIIGKKLGKLQYVICSQDNDYYISSTDDKTQRNIIYKISDEEELLNTFGGREGSGLGQLSSNCRPFAIDKYGRLIVPDKENKRVLLLNAHLEYMTTLLSDFEIRICGYDADRLFIGLCYPKDEIQVYNISQFEPDRIMKFSNPMALRIDGGKDEVRMVGSISIEDTMRGVAVLFDKIYILTSQSILIHCGRDPYKRIYKKDFYDDFNNDFWDIASDDRFGGRFFITNKKNHCIWTMGIDLRRTKWLEDIGSPYTLSVSKDGSVIIPNNKQQSIDVYEGKKAQLQQSIKLSLNSNNLRHAIQIQDVYVVCHGWLREEFHDVDDECVINEVLLVSSNGDILRSFKGTEFTNIYLPNHLAVYRECNILVADGKNKRVLRLNNQLELEKILLSNDDQGLDEPQRLCYDEKSDQILICNSQSVDIFSFNLDIQMRKNDKNSSSSCSDQDDYTFELPTFQKINQMNEQMLQDAYCCGAALLRDRLYLVYCGPNFMSVHRNDPPFDLIEKVEMTACVPEIVASSAHDCCYIGANDKICRLLYGSQRSEVFLEDGIQLCSMSVTAEGQLLVMCGCSVLASYNSDGECTECIFLNNPIKNFFDFSYCVKTADGKIIYASADDDEYREVIFERSVDGSIYISHGPFENSSSRCFHRAIDFKDEQMLLLDERNEEILLYDYKAHRLRTLLTEDDHQMSKIKGFCYSREKKQLILCGSEGILFFQLSQNEQHGQSCEELESLSCKKKMPKEKDALERTVDRILYAVRVGDIYDYSFRGIARLENKTFILYSSELRVINSKDIRTKGFDKDVHVFKIPEEDLALKEGGLWDIAASHSDLCVYVTDQKNRCVWSVTLDHKIKKWLTDIDSPFKLSVNDDGCVCIPDNHYKQLDIYDSNGIRKNSIRLPRFMNYLCHAVQTPSGNYVICGNNTHLDEDEDEDGDSESEKTKRTMIKQLMKGISEESHMTFLCEISPEGELIRTFSTTQVTSSSQLLVNPRHLAADADGRIFVADSRSCNYRVLLFDNQLKFIETLADEFEDYALLKALCYDNHTKELLCLVSNECTMNLLICIKV